MKASTFESYGGPTSCNNTISSPAPWSIETTIQNVVTNGEYDNIRRKWTGLQLKAGESIQFFDSNNYTNRVINIVGPYSGNYDSGCIQFTSGYTSYKLVGTPDSECSENSDCPEGEKCVDGECVPCDEQQATHFQIRFEYPELATDSGGSQSMYHLSSVIPIAGSEELVIQGTEVNQAKYYPRIRFCNALGSIRPYTGTFSFYGFCTPDKEWALFPCNGDLNEESTYIGVESQTDAVSNNPWFLPRVLINHMDASLPIYETECSSVVPKELPEIEPVLPVEPTQPEEPPEEPPAEPEEPTEPTKPIQPDSPEAGCECEIFIGEQIARAADIIYDGLILLKRELSVVGREIVVEMWEARKQQYQLSMFLQNQQYQVLLSQHQRLYDILQAVQKGLIKDNDGLIDIVKTGLVEGDKGLVDYVKEFTDNYEPVTIENEYRTQSHRVIDNLDEVVSKL